MCSPSVQRADRIVARPKQEEQKFKKAFKDPKFRELMNDYMEEISDPKHRKVRSFRTFAARG